MSPRIFWAILAVLTLVTVVPLWVVELPAFADYPNHLARAKILAHYNEVPFYREFWRPAWTILPNILTDLLLVGAAKVLPIYTAGRLVLSLCLTSVIVGVAVLRRTATGGYDAIGWSGALLAYAFPVQMGFLNYTLGCGLMLLVLALHLRLRERRTPRYLAALVPGMAVLFLCHLVAFLLALVAITAWEMSGALRASSRTSALRRLVIRLVAIVALPVVFFKLSPTSGHVNVWESSSLLGKARALLMTLTVGDRLTDVVFLAGLALLAVLVWRARFGWRREALFVLGATTLLFLAAPFGLGSQNLDSRLPFAIALLGLGLLRLRKSDSEQNGVPRGLAGGVGVLVLIHAVFFAGVQIRRGAGLDRLRAQIRELPQRSLLFVATDEAEPVWRFSEWEPPLPHAHALAVLDGEIFSSGLFAIRGQQPMGMKPGLQALYWYHAASPPDPSKLSKQIDALLERVPAAYRQRPKFLMVNGPVDPSDALPILASGHRYAIYRLP